MGKYRIAIKKSAGKELAGISSKDQRRIIERIRGLAENPRPTGSKKLSGEEKYRIRQGDCRLLYEINDAVVTVTVVRVAHRKDVYRH